MVEWRLLKNRYSGTHPPLATLRSKLRYEARVADPPKEGILLAENRLRMIPSFGGVPAGRGGFGPKQVLSKRHFGHGA